MKLFGFFGKVNENSKKYKREKAKSYDGKLLRYVTESTEKGEVVIGKDGNMTLHDGKLIINGSGKTLFVCDAEEVVCGDLMSLDGVVVTGFDEVTGKERSVVAYFKYYRK